MKTFLKVPYSEKDEAKRLGARWDAARKAWYVENMEDLSPFMRWMHPRDLRCPDGAVFVPDKKSSSKRKPWSARPRGQGGPRSKPEGNW